MDISFISTSNFFVCDHISLIIQGDVTKLSDVEKVFEGQGVTGVIVALGGKTKDVGPTMLTDGTYFSLGIYVSRIYLIED